MINKYKRNPFNDNSFNIRTDIFDKEREIKKKIKGFKECIIANKMLDVVIKKNKMPKKIFKTAIHMMTADIFLVIAVLTVVDRSFSIFTQ